MSPSDGHEATVFAVAHRQQLPPEAIPGALIGDSWKRCVDEYGLSPERVDMDVLTRTELVAHRDQVGEVMAIARGEMDNLANQIAGSGYALLLTNASGVILCHHADHMLEQHFRAAGLWDGADWSENRLGTNGIGTALIERRPVTVHCGDHFATRNIGLSCSAAPIHAPGGRILGVLDASSVQGEGSRVSQMHTRALVGMSARLIEKQLFLRAYRAHRILRFHSRPEFVNLIHDGMLALDDDGRICAADAGAAMQLDCDERGALRGRALSDLFELTPEDAARRMASGAVWPVRGVRYGRRFFASFYIDPAALGHAHRDARVQTRAQGVSRPELGALAGGDARMAHNVRSARKVIDKGIQIMLCGETGTGKEVFARALHDASSRADKPFVAVNCAAIPESLIESELFGYKAGAFTGARRDGMRGRIMQSSGGTLFLDEIGDMPVELQTRLLRVLEEREVVPLGDEKAYPVDLNLISATHAPLKTMLADGRFRADLYYRLNGFSITLPPLRERTDRQALLREMFAAGDTGSGTVAVDEDVMTLLQSHAWPGNLREMHNVVRAALALCDGRRVTRADLPADILAECDMPVSGHAAHGDSPLVCAERDALVQALGAYGWNVSGTARGLGVSRNTLYRKMRKHRIAGPSQH